MTPISLETLTCRLDEGLARVTLTRPEIGNPIDGAFCRDIRELSVTLSTDEAVRAVLITAEGRFFSVGGDIRSFVKDRAALPRIVKGWTADLHMGLSRLQRMNAPVVCAVQGDIAGGAVSLAASADVLYAAEGVKFNAAFALIGFCADSGSTVTLSNRMGLSRAKRFLLMSETLTATEAQTAGLVDFALPPGDMMAAAEKTARRFAKGPTLAYGGIKATILTARTEAFETQLEHEAQTLARLSASDDAWEGLTAFAARRKPAFRGH